MELDNEIESRLSAAQTTLHIQVSKQRHFVGVASTYLRTDSSGEARREG